ncbi:Pre-mRNA cleavage complex II protein Clp1-domain-containing protein [Xylaria bambusicola]|uniref:Pre-mRNA cleavage complex II protein Clp1-domain-containing protein n=1 Tax=Xylaria bambusicola TaxID=326684 RepID=UPI002007A6F1|nr:Pre-mRNA cleavage complex II protein Clp1-domain-containing protein [Xylaria bambusicola]KAI0525868.1 Pre-mRNA cleavage complex II protein Clp1-domain-containing protein [Xylaria bambusicola]
MSIPGLGQLAPTATPIAAAASSAAPAPTTTQTLEPYWEYRFEVPHGSSLTIKLVSGTAEKDGTELAPNTPYIFSATKSKINTWHGCSLEITAPSSGTYDAYTSEPTADETPMVSYLNLHFKLESLRAVAQKSAHMGPRVLIVGPPNAGKSSLVRTLASWATRMGRQPLVVNTDSREGMLTLPGTLSAAVFATLIDITTDWGSLPSSGASAIPVKLPLAYYYGLPQSDDNPKLFKRLLGRLAVAATSRLAEDVDVKSAGMLIDTGGVPTGARAVSYYEFVAHIVAEFSVNIIVVVGSERVGSEMQKRFAGQTTSVGETITVVGLDKSGGVMDRDEAFMQSIRESAIREYFFGNTKMTLSPFTQQVDFAAVSIWRINDAPIKSLADSGGITYDEGETHPADLLEKAEPSMMMQNCVLAVACASVHDPPDTIRDANIMGFVYVADVDEKRHRLRILAPVSARLSDRPLLWGSWPEHMVNLLI